MWPYLAAHLLFVMWPLWGCGLCRSAPGCCAAACRPLRAVCPPLQADRALASSCRLNPQAATAVAADLPCRSGLPDHGPTHSSLTHCRMARRCVDSLNALKHEALLWRERALQVVRQNSLFMRQQLLRSEVRSLTDFAATAALPEPRYFLPEHKSASATHLHALGHINLLIGNRLSAWHARRQD